MLSDKEKASMYETLIAQYVDDLRSHDHSDSVLQCHIVEFEHALFMCSDDESIEPSNGLIQLLNRHGFESTGNAKEDIQIARLFMPSGMN